MKYIGLIPIILLTIGMIYCILFERKSWNNGYCPNCNLKWRQFDIDSQGGRGYICDNCNRTIWILYPRIDK